MKKDDSGGEEDMAMPVPRGAAGQAFYPPFNPRIGLADYL